MGNPIKMDDLGVPPFLETPIYIYIVALNKTNCHTKNRARFSGDFLISILFWNVLETVGMDVLTCFIGSCMEFRWLDTPVSK